MALISFLSLYRLDNYKLTLLEVIGGFLAGWLLGRLTAYGRLPMILKQKNLSLKAEPEHIDQVCGWQPLEDFLKYHE
ncbi:hypothetical protein [Acaryochloris sp. IP29b_bin.148]|uniref:hypothetical protein n=1 Tax=Acaryochloris sp. IP29b_bin.148 TaxID=2969218 RepID=UPI0026359260|nr:hypothetical protein [Acaryochloris sp. IP29b_bin.148]